MVRSPSISQWMLAVLAIATFLFCTPNSVRAGESRPCTEPAVFQDAAVNAFILPYRFDGPSQPSTMQLASRQISALVHLEVLYSMIKYGSVGAVDLIAVPGQVCDVDKVIFHVTRSGASGMMKPGQALVVVWGRLFEQGDELYVQSYMAFLRQGQGGAVREMLRVAIQGDKVAVELVAGLPTQSIAFPARRISKADLARVDREFRHSMVVRPRPDLSAPGKSIDFAPEIAFPYWVTKVDGDWMYIEPMMGGPAGWVRARTGESAEQWSLERWLPELAFVDAANGFMRLRAGGGIEDPERRAKFAAAIDIGLRRFEKVVSVDDAPVAYALGDAIRGFVSWNEQPVAKQRAGAAALFATAAQRASDYSEARNLAAVTRSFRTDEPFDAKGVSRLERELMGALALDPSTRDVLENLDQLYRVYAAQPDWSPFTAEELITRRAVIKATQEKVIRPLW